MMMNMKYKTIIFILLILISGYNSGVYLPWWSVMIASFLIAFLFPLSLGISFSLALLLTAAVWYFVSSYIQNSSGSDLLIMIGEMFMGVSMLQLFIITGIIGGVSAGLGAITGRALRRVQGK